MAGNAAGNDLSTEAGFLAVTGLSVEDLRRLGFYFAKRWACERLRDDAVGAFLLGAVRAAQFVDCALPDANPKHYVIKGGVQWLLEFLRREQRLRPAGTWSLEATVEGAEDGDTLAARTPDPRTPALDERLLGVELRASVRAAVAGLPAKERAAIQAIDLDRLGGREAGEQCGLTPARVYQLRKRGLWRLARRRELACHA